MAEPGAAPGADLAPVVIHYETAAGTLACLESLAALPLGLRRVLVIDNASTDVATLAAGIERLALPLELIHNPDNLGFAGASEQAVRRLLEDPGVARVLMLNNTTASAIRCGCWSRACRADCGCGSCRGSC
ncbi:MAG TPA: glycosyltransferase [Xanthomonadaceae bacterium]|nr:glycosyltransferase [Xanthomonadaceae bacterium]